MPGKQHLTRTWRSREVPGHFGGESRSGKSCEFVPTKVKNLAQAKLAKCWEFQKINILNA